MTSAITLSPAAADAVAHFAGRLAYETDVSDVAAALEDGGYAVVVIDSRSRASWDQGHVAGAIHLPTADIASRAGEVVDRDVAVVTYCWGPGCNGATRAALEFAKLGYQVKEMIGGFEYWMREGMPVATESGITRNNVDPLTAPLNAISCDC